MTTDLTTPVAIRVLPAPGADRVRAVARRAGLSCAPGHDPRALTVIVAGDAEHALRGVRGPGPLVLVCDGVTRTGLLLALRSGAVVLRSVELSEDTLTAAVRRAGRPHQSIPYPVLSQLLAGSREHGDRWPPSGVPTTLTGRQVSVLRLMAEGHANADIARLLSCSEHTVKNVVHEVMSRLQARNRAHAVARAVRLGLV
ncbi:LuxR C-terminal-related transcriptional regulator [Streptomyces sp. NPDC047028]|uniref:helix-turn-helix transcriptional regulator n=1 Tax=Streptomyces sp. NPDC047028 TaxID=3155793 RepID=UPI0033F5F57E